MDVDFAITLVLGLSGIIVISTASILGIIEISRERSDK